MITEIQAVTIVVGDLSASRALYEGLLGMRVVASWHVADDSAGAAHLATRWGLSAPPTAAGVWLQQPGAKAGAIHLVTFSPGTTTRLVDGARPYDHGYVKNLDFFTDDVAGAYTKFARAGHGFPSPPVTYPVPWGSGVTATEAHLPTGDGVKISLASLQRAPRQAFGEASRETAFTEVAAATQIVADYDRAVQFYCDVFDCVPAAETVIDDRALAETLELPPETRLRLCFIGPPRAAGGKVGLVSYEGPGVTDARAVWQTAPPGARGVLSLSFITDDVDGRAARAAIGGASLVMAPATRAWPVGGRARVATLRSPDGVLLELIEPDPGDARLVPLAEQRELTEGTPRSVVRPEVGRVVLARVEGHVFALEDRCPHLGGPLSRGVLRGRHLTCPWHGWVIDVPTGRVVGGRGLSARGCALRQSGTTICARLAVGAAAQENS
jgi:nitrite reductase (NADH) small subunit